MEPDGSTLMGRYKGTVLGSGILWAWEIVPAVNRGTLVERSRLAERLRLVLRVSICLKALNGLRKVWLLRRCRPRSGVGWEA